MKTYKKIKLGTNKYGERIYLTPPSWDCGWSFGYIGNRNLHTHLDSVEGWNKNSPEALKEYFNDFIIKDGDIYKFIEIAKTIYHYKKHSEILNRGGMHYTTNPCKDILKNGDQYNEVNKKILPALFEAFYTLIEENLKNPMHYKNIEEFALEGDTKKIVNYLFKNKLTPDDLVLHEDKETYKKTFIEGIITSDWDAIHSLYYKTLHAK